MFQACCLFVQRAEKEDSSVIVPWPVPDDQALGEPQKAGLHKTTNDK